MKKILAEVLGMIRPSKEEVRREIAFAKDLVSLFQTHSMHGCEVVLTGSVAKKTFLKDKRDIDIFVLFDRSIPREMLEMLIVNVMESTLPGTGYQISYAEHPYVRFHYQGRRIDLVPAYKITDASERQSAVDRSVLHTAFVKKRLNGKMTGDVLLLKAFLKANSLYGAEIKVKGFSGYLCELLVIKSGSFRKLISAVSKWDGRKPIFIDIKGYHTGRMGRAGVKEMQENLGKFVVIDPTDSNRNVAAAVSAENLAAFITLCKRFSKKPSQSFFTRKPETFDERLKKLALIRKSHVFMITLPRPDVVDDVLWGQLYRMMNQLEDHLSEYDPVKIVADDSRHIVRIALVLSKKSLPAKMKIEGPPLSMEKHVKGFARKHRGARFFISKRRMMAEVDRPIADAHSSIEEFFRAFEHGGSHLAAGEELVIIEELGKNGKPLQGLDKTPAKKKTRTAKKSRIRVKKFRA